MRKKRWAALLLLLAMLGVAVLAYSPSESPPVTAYVAVVLASAVVAEKLAPPRPATRHRSRMARTARPAVSYHSPRLGVPDALGRLKRPNNAGPSSPRMTPIRA